MKKLILALIGIGVTTSATMVVVKWQGHPPSSTKTVAPSAITAPPNANDSPILAKVNDSEPPQRDSAVPEAAGKPVNTLVTTSSGTDPLVSAAGKPSVVSGFSQPLQMLVSPQASYAQKQAAWKQLKDTHQLDKAITDLEQAVASDSSVAEYPAALGQAYVQKLRTLEDFREQSILAIKADQSFDQALGHDPSNWEARYWKALSLSYWPAELNKSPEVIDNLVTLVEQQESRPPQPHFAQTYVLLGEQYVKAGYADDARAIWQRGASRFPVNDTLREKLAGLQ